MVDKIAARLDLAGSRERIYIEDITTEAGAADGKEDSGMKWGSMLSPRRLSS